MRKVIVSLALILFIQREFLGISLADRPLILLSILLLIFGIQLFAIGWVAEIIIFTHSRESKEYIIEEIFHVDGKNNISGDEKVDSKESIKS